MKKATLETLLNRKNAEKKQTYTIELNTIGLSFTAEKLPLGKLLYIMDGHEIDNKGNYSDKFELFKELCYHSIPLLHDKRLLEAYNVVEPYDIVNYVLDDNIQAITELATKIMDMYGLSSGETIKEIKN